MKPTRVSAFIDGFNLYHAIDRHGLNHLKWIDLAALCRNFAPAPTHILGDVFFFSAYATWRPGAYARHRAYIRALETVGVTPVLGKFKEKDRQCRRCQAAWKDHEEKETDVNIALYLLFHAFRDTYDRALIISQDSDLAPAVRLVKSEFPAKQIRIITPINLAHSSELAAAAGGTANCRRIQQVHLERALLPREVHDNTGRCVAVRPSQYDPPV